MLSNAVLSCSRFEALSSVTIYFGSKSSYSVLPDVFNVLGDLTHTIPYRRTLSLIGSANGNYEAIASHSKFLSVLERLRSLKLHFIHTRYANDHPHLFFTQFITTWLTPIMPNLTNLVLSSDSYWGYLPKVNLSRLFFPHLQALALGKYLFSHDWQLHWITKHGKTLQKLYLYDCPIVTRTIVYGYFDNDGYPIIGLGHFHPIGERERIYSATWLEYLQEMASSLRELQVFKVIYDSEVDHSMPKAKTIPPCFQTYETMETSIQGLRYMDWDTTYKRKEDWLIWQWNPLGERRSEERTMLEISESDREALETMLRTVEARRRTKTTY